MRVALILVACAAACFGFALSAGSSTPAFSAPQARVGRTLYYENCAECHGAQLQGQYGPALAGPDGNLQWESTQYVFQYMTGQMPVGNAGGLTAREYLQIMAFLLQSHGHPGGAHELTAAAANSSLVPIGPK